MSNRPLITIEVNTDALADKLDKILEALKTIADASPGHAVKRDPAEVTKQNLQQLVDPILDTDTTTSIPIQIDDTDVAPQQAVPSSDRSAKESKTICKDWLHHGSCSYPECQWAHKMPQDLEGLKREHLNAFPRCYVGKQVSSQGSPFSQASKTSPVAPHPPDHSQVSERPRLDVDKEVQAMIRDGAILDRLERTEYQAYNLEKPFPTVKDVYEELFNKIQEGNLMHCSNFQVKLEICKGLDRPKTSSENRDLYRIPSLVAVDGRIPGLEIGYQLARGHGHIIINDDAEERMKCIEHLTRDLEGYTRGLPEGVDIPPELAIPFKTRQEREIVVLAPTQSSQRSWPPAGSMSWVNNTQADELHDCDSPPSPAQIPGNLSRPMTFTHKFNTRNTPVTSPSLPHDGYDENCYLCHGERGDIKCHKCRHFGHLSLSCKNPLFAEGDNRAFRTIADDLSKWQ